MFVFSLIHDIQRFSVSVSSSVSCWDVGDFWSEQLRLRKVNDWQRIILHAAMPEVTEVHAGILFFLLSRTRQAKQWGQDNSPSSGRSVQRPSGSEAKPRQEVFGCRSDPTIPPGRVYQSHKICCQLIAVCVFVLKTNDDNEKEMKEMRRNSSLKNNKRG